MLSLCFYPMRQYLSAGGGEYRPDSSDTPNLPKDSHRDAQIFRPPYLFRGKRPQLTLAPEEAQYGATFTIDTPDAADIAQVSWVRLSSVTHSFNTGQRLNFLHFEKQQGKLGVTAPPDANVCPPGHYILFLLNAQKVPSIGKIIRIFAPAAPVQHAAIAPHLQTSTADLDEAVKQEPHGTHAVLGLTSTCPYGLAACWGGAYEALKTLSGVGSVRPIANAQDSTADVYMDRDAVPDVDLWWEEISRVARGSYDLRGVEISITGTVVPDAGGLALSGPHLDNPLPLRPLGATAKVQFDRANNRPQPATQHELSSFDRLAAEVTAQGTSNPRWIIGVLAKELSSVGVACKGFQYESRLEGRHNVKFIPCLM